jgi:hypothetical protein
MVSITLAISEHLKNYDPLKKDPEHDHKFKDRRRVSLFPEIGGGALCTDSMQKLGLLSQRNIF